MHKISTLQFPSQLIPLKQSAIVGAAIESSGYTEHNTPYTLHLNGLRRIYLLLTSPSEITEPNTIHTLNLNRMRTREDVFNVTKENHPYESIGYKWGWLPEIEANGHITIDEIIPFPWREIFEDERLPAQATVVIGTLNRTATIQLPPAEQPAPAKTELFVHGASIRIATTVPEPPDSGTRLVA